jgi:hypothetical protein
MCGIRVPERSVVAAVLLLLAIAVPAYATLGENVSSIGSDQAHSKAATRSVRTQFYSVQEMQTPAGTTIRQFVSPSGTVFGVSWQGSAPDLQQLLGTYFEQFVSASHNQRSPRGRGIHIDNGDLVIDTGGHMRYVVGRAFLRSKMPSQVSGDEIR